MTFQLPKCMIQKISLYENKISVMHESETKKAGECYGDQFDFLSGSCHCFAGMHSDFGPFLWKTEGSV